MEIVFKYAIDNKEQHIHCFSTFENDDLSISTIKNHQLTSIILQAKKQIKVIEAKVIVPLQYNAKQILYSNGFQSWSNSFETDINGQTMDIKAPSWIRKYYALDSYGDYRFYKYQNRKGFIQSHNYTYIRQHDNYHLFGSKTDQYGFTIFEHQCPNNRLVIYKDLKDVFINDRYPLFEIIELVGIETVFDEYFKLMGIKSLQDKRILGYTSWYNHYQDINETKILQALDNIDNQKYQVFQIDDGFETFVGDWLSIDENKFPNGLKPIIQKIHDAGLMAGIWLAPFECEAKSKLYQLHQDWLIKDQNGKPLKVGHNWSGSYALNLENTQVKDYLRKVFDYYINELKIDFFKLDFLYAASVLPTKFKSRGQISYESIKFLRELCQDKLILGCGVPLQSCYGIFDYCRIGTDVALQFDEPWHMSLMHRERTLTKNCILNTIYRRHLNKRAFINDPDVFLLRKDNIKLSENQKKAVLIINNLFGDLLFTSDNIGDYDEKQIALLEKTLMMNRDNIRVSHNKDIIIIQNEEFLINYNSKNGNITLNEKK